MNKRAIRSFVKETLGCSCPETVFEKIRFERDAELDQCLSRVSRVQLGDRLLIYLLVSDSPGIIERDLPVIIRSGERERDQCGFNRFRAVVCAADTSAVIHSADGAFARCEQKHGKVHLHVVSRNEVKAIFEPNTEV